MQGKSIPWSGARYFSHQNKTTLEARQMLTSKTGQQLLKEAAKTHRDNIRRNLEHRLQVARTEENQELIHLLNLELKQLYPDVARPDD